MKTRAIFTGFAVGTALAGTVFAAAEVGSNTSRPDDHPSAFSELRALKGVTTPTAAEAKVLSILAAAPQAQDHVDAAIISPSSRHAGVAPGTQRLAVTVNGSSAGPDNVYLSPAKDGVCFDSTSYLFGGCLGDSNIATGSVQSAICSPYLDDDKYAIYGVLPDGVDHVTLSLADGSTKDVPVTRNAIALLLSKSAPLVKQISWTLPDGSKQNANPVPSDANAGTCAPTQPARATADLHSQIQAAIS